MPELGHLQAIHYLLFRWMESGETILRAHYLPGILSYLVL